MTRRDTIDRAHEIIARHWATRDDEASALAIRDARHIIHTSAEVSGGDAVHFRPETLFSYPVGRDNRIWRTPGHVPCAVGDYARLTTHDPDDVTCGHCRRLLEIGQRGPMELEVPEWRRLFESAGALRFGYDRDAIAEVIAWHEQDDKDPRPRSDVIVPQTLLARRHVGNFVLLQAEFDAIGDVRRARATVERTLIEAVNHLTNAAYARLRCWVHADCRRDSNLARACLRERIGRFV